MKKFITKLSDMINDQHAQRVLFDLDFDTENPEVFARVEGMGITLNFLLWLNGIKANWYSFQGVRDRIIFIFLYPLSVSFCYALYDVWRIINYIARCGRK